MKLQSIELHDFLSHGSTRFELNGARLASIVGANGAGKSSLLDGVLYALYDAARAKTDQLVRLGATDMSASVVFEYSGQTYRATRGRTTRSGGKTYLELAVMHGDAWTPLTGDDIRATQLRIDELLGLDAATFTTAAFLRQGDADSFIVATAGERKRILGQALGLERYARAESRARDLARDLEGRTEAGRSLLERTSDVIAELAPVRAVLATRRDEKAGLASEAAGCRETLAAAQERLRERDTALAAAAAQAGELDRAERDVAALIERYTRTRDRRAAAAAAIASAEVLVAGAGEVEEAIANLPTARSAVESLEAGEAEQRRLAADAVAQRTKVLGLERPYEQAFTTFVTRRDAAAAKVTEAEAHGKAGTSTCEACGQAIGRDVALQQLAAARAALAAIEEPKRPVAIDLEQGKLTRLEGRLREIDVPADILAAARRLLAETERTAARAGEIAAARATLEREQATVAEIDIDLSNISAEGAQARTRLEELNTAAADLERIRRERGEAVAEVTRIQAAIEGLEVRARELEGAIARAEASVERLDALTAEQADLTAKLGESSTELERLRRLVTAFGVGGIPARIIESVLPELGRYANELLADLRPGMALEIRAQREKKSGKGTVEALDLIVQDDVGERPLAVFSGGERMSVSLALAVGLSRLVARRAGTAIRTLVIDEPDGLDADARRAFGQALRVLAHHGELERVVLVSHHPDLAEFGDAVYEVTKNGSGSVVEQVA